MNTDTIKKAYLAKFDELNVMETRLTNFDYEKPDAKERFDDVLIEAYLLGFKSAAYMLGDDETLTPDYAKAITDTDITYADGETTTAKFDKYYDDQDGLALRKLTETEWHRMYNQGASDSADKVKSTYGERISKRWETVKDDKVRATHEYLQGVTIPIDAEFVTNDGDKAKAPGLFTKPENNVNCRCMLVYKRE